MCPLCPQEAAAIPFVALTAWEAIWRVGGAEKGQRMLVLGGGSAVGGAAVQLARAWGLEARAGDWESRPAFALSAAVALTACAGKGGPPNWRRAVLADIGSDSAYPPSPQVAATAGERSAARVEAMGAEVASSSVRAALASQHCFSTSYALETAPGLPASMLIHATVAAMLMQDAELRLAFRVVGGYL